MITLFSAKCGRLSWLLSVFEGLLVLAALCVILIVDRTLPCPWYSCCCSWRSCRPRRQSWAVVVNCTTTKQLHSRHHN